MSDTVEQSADPIAELEEVIADMQRARNIHEWWARYFEQNPDDPDAKAVGNPDWHWDWVRRYDRVLAILESIHQTHQS